MKSENFCFWLQGFFELNESVAKESGAYLNATQIEQIKTHLALVFKHDPAMAHKAPEIGPSPYAPQQTPAFPNNPYQPPYDTGTSPILPGILYC